MRREILDRLNGDRAAERARRPRHGRSTAAARPWSTRKARSSGDALPDAVAAGGAGRAPRRPEPAGRGRRRATWFVHVHNPPARMVIVGAVHITQALAGMAETAGYDVIVCDPRRAFADDARFPAVEVSTEWPDDALNRLVPDHRTAVVTLTHDPKIDDPALEVAVRAPVFYIGALGSRRTHGKRLERLREKGFSDDELGRIHAPIGLAIGARSPAEIAVSIMAR